MLKKILVYTSIAIAGATGVTYYNQLNDCDPFSEQCPPF